MKRIRKYKVRGALLLTLLVFIALMGIAMLEVVPYIETQKRRYDYEELASNVAKFKRAVDFFYQFERLPENVTSDNSLYPDTEGFTYLDTRWEDDKHKRVKRQINLDAPNKVVQNAVLHALIRRGYLRQGALIGRLLTKNNVVILPNLIKSSNFEKLWFTDEVKAYDYVKNKYEFKTSEATYIPLGWRLNQGQDGKAKVVLDELNDKIHNTLKFKKHVADIGLGSRFIRIEKHFTLRSNLTQEPQIGGGGSGGDVK